MRRNHTPYWLHWIKERWNRFWVDNVLAPQFDALGIAPKVLKPRSVEVTGRNIVAGDHLHLLSDSKNPVRLCTWSGKGIDGQISIGHYCLISPGTQMMSAGSITIGDNCMFAANSYLSDSDWHGLYNRLRPFRCTKPIVLKDNVWIGHGAKVGKGVTIGCNSVVAAGAVVVRDVPDNVVVGGNPAKVIKHLNPGRRMLKRQWMFEGDDRDWLQWEDNLNRAFLASNTFWGWLRTRLFPTRED